MAALAVLFLMFIAATLAIIVFPPTDRPARANAILMLGGDGDRRDRALELARAGYAPVLALSTPSTHDCPTVPNVKVICFRPDPFTTQGEAREAGRLAAQYGWTRMIFVTDRSQNVRARLRIARCYDGKKIMVSVDPPVRDWPYLIAYQWSAMFKALVWQRGC
ncbi:MULTISPECIES: YdcF family protein [unclassified Frankia]|uniref:YdcF family protein n=1 Tax=unclassified Frankia TaxID=2632575 RepID=UPI0027DC7A88|nr:MULTISPECIES: YdcF family protein [unclassified Frankia]